MNNAREDEYFGQRLREHDQQADWGPVAPQRNVLPVIGGALVGGLLNHVWAKQSATGKSKQVDTKIDDAVNKLNKQLQKVLIEKQNVLDQILSAQSVAVGDLHSLVESAEDANVPREQYARVQSLLDEEEFRLPDANDDGYITRPEFEQYIKTYIRETPGATRADMPRFEDFDIDGNGRVNLKEWRNYVMEQRKQQDAEKQLEIQYLTGLGSDSRFAQAAPPGRQRRAA